MPSEEMDELDAREAAQFKADVQGHRQQEVFAYDHCTLTSASRMFLSASTRHYSSQGRAAKAVLAGLWRVLS